MRHLSENLLELQAGFNHRGQVWHLIMVGCKGDLPFLAKTGNFVRHWLRADRKDDARTRHRPSPGVCWLCLGGTDGRPWEDVNQNALWNATPTTIPWEIPSPLMSLFHSAGSPETMFHTDLFHNFHGGLGMYFVSSSLVECLSLLDGTVDERASQMTAAHVEWASMKGNRLPHSGRFKKQRVGLTSLQVMPDAKWAKFDDTRSYLSFMEWWLLRRQDAVGRSEVLRRVLAATQAANRLFHVLYTPGLWMESSEAAEVAKLGRIFVKIYAELASICYGEGRLRYPMVVKMHMCDHEFRRMLKVCNRRWILNPLCKTTQADEDSCPRGFLFSVHLSLKACFSGLCGTGGTPFQKGECKDQCIPNPTTVLIKGQKSLGQASKVTWLCGQFQSGIQMQENCLRSGLCR